MKTNILKTTFLVLFSSLFLQVYGVCTPDVITPNVNINNGGWVSNGLPTLAAGGYIDFGPGPTWLTGTWSWTGPLSFTSTDRGFRLSNVQPNQSGNYIATFINATTLCTSQYTFTLTVTGQCVPTVITPNVQINNGAWVQSLNATLAAGGVVNFGPGPSWLTGSWSWTGPNGFTASGRGFQLTNVQSNQSGDYVVTYINEAGCSSQLTHSLTVVSKGTPTLSLSASSVSYNGSAQAASVNSSVAGSVSNILYAGSATAPTNVGSYPITANFTPTDGTNYNSLTSASAGTFTINPATLTLNTGSTTNVSSYTLPQLANSNIVVSTGELVINQTATIQSVTVAPGAKLTHSSGTLTATNGITLESDATGTATLLDSYSSPTIGATVKQYVTAGRNWYISAPLNNTADYTVLNKGNSVAEYNEVTGLWPTLSSGTLTRGKGYVQVASATQGTTGTVSFNGTTNSGNVPVTLTNTLAGGKGFNLVGNPYPSYLSWPAVAADNAAANMPTGTMWYRTISYNGKSAWAPNTAYSLNNIVYNGTRFYKVTTAGTSAASGGPSGTTAGITDNSVVWNYEGSIYIFATISSSGVASPATVSNMVPPMQAFWVKSTGGTLTFKNAMRSHNTGGANALKAPKSLTNDIKLIRLNVSNGASADEAVIYTSANASNAFDTYDAPKYFNLAGSNQPEIYTQVGSEKLVINAMSELNQGTEIPLGFATEKGNNFTISASEFRNFGSDIKVMLKDKQSTTEFDLTTGQSYAFSSSAVNNTDRFSLIFRAPDVATGMDNGTKLNTQVFINAANQITIIAPEKGNYAIFNAMGQLIENGILNTKHETRNAKFSAGVYFVELSVNGQREIRKVIIR